MRRIFYLILFIAISTTLSFAVTHTISGRVIDKKSREPMPYINVVIWNSTTGTTTDSLGYFSIKNLAPGVYRLQASFIGYNTYFSPEFQLSSKNKFFEIEIEESVEQLKEVNVVAGPFKKTAETPIALRVIGFSEIEKSAGSGRDISRVIQSFPGVASSPAGYRNDLIVRGGGPSENRFYIDGVEIPNINHFATQGASGGPVGILNSDFIRETDFYSGAFPASKGNVLSSVLDFKLKDGSTQEHNRKFALGSSDVAYSMDGHVGEKVTYLFSVRQSYLQFLFKALNLPFLPTFNDAQFKVKVKFDKKNELTLLGLGAIDDMKLNTDTVGQTDGNKYILSTLPTIKQNTYTLGAVYKHFAGSQVQTLVLSTNKLNNSNLKYFGNEESNGILLDYNSYEQETKLRFENSSSFGNFRLISGINGEVADYYNNTFGQYIPAYKTNLSIFKYGFFGSLLFENSNGHFTGSFALRTDANSYSALMNNPIDQLSPRLSASYRLRENFYLNANVGRYYQLPAYTVLGYQNGGNFVNKSMVNYLQSDQVVVGLEQRPSRYIRLTMEGFYKKYDHALLSIKDKIPLASKGADYDILGTEEVNSNADGRAYGVELLARWSGYKNLNFIAAYTLVRSEFTTPDRSDYIPTSWDNRHLLTITGGYEFRRNWSLGLKYRLIGGAPYTRWNESLSSLKANWDKLNRPILDYANFNQDRLPLFSQLDLRIDKSYFFKNWMLGFYLDIQNATNSKFKGATQLLSTGVTDPLDNSRYVMKTIQNENGNLLPSIGIMVEF
ncbi:MAG: TonB-dependent receptor [Bacteroidales bacterium]|nr:TonB-dependent receptor [Bacteroidales bacterium]